MTPEQFDTFCQHFTALVKEAEPVKPTGDLLMMVYLTMMYAPAIQHEIHREVTEIVNKWAKRNRDLIDEECEEADRDWFRNFEWPEDLD